MRNLGKILPGFLAVLSWACLFSQQAVAQPLVKEQLENSLKNQNLLLRGFPGSKIVEYTWTASGLHPYPQKAFVAGAFQTHVVRVHQTAGTVDQVTLEGERAVVLKAPDGTLGLAPQRAPLVLHIDLAGAPPETVTNLRDLLFFRSQAEMLAAIPAQWVRLVPAEATSAPGKNSLAPSNTSQLWVNRDNQWIAIDKSRTPKPGQPVNAPQLELSEEFRRVGGQA